MVWYVNLCFASEYIHAYLRIFVQPLCVAMSRYAESRNPLPKQVASWFPIDRKWPIEDLSEDKKLNVYFMNKCPSEWKYRKHKISRHVIMKMLQESWSGCFLPKNSKKYPHARIQIRVQFQGNLF